MSIAMAGIGVGGTIFSPVITWLLGAYGWRSTYRIMALIILVLALPAALFILRKRPEDMGLYPMAARIPPLRIPPFRIPPPGMPPPNESPKRQTWCFR